MTQPNISDSAPASAPEAPAPKARVWKSRGRIFGIPVSLIAIWAALFLAASAIPALPVPGMAGMITMNAILTAIAGIVLGPAAGIANMAGGILGMILFPYGSFYGPLSFLTVTMGGFVAGLAFADKWKWAGILEILVLGSWFINPASWQHLMWMVPLPYSLITLIVIFVGPVRRWARKQILTLNKVWMWPAIFLFASIGHSAEYMVSNSMTNWMWNLRWQYWIPTLPYWIGVDTVIIVLGTIVGAGILTGLRRARLPHASDLYVTEESGKNAA